MTGVGQEQAITSNRLSYPDLVGSRIGFIADLRALSAAEAVPAR